MTSANLSNYLIHRRESIATDLKTWRFAATMTADFQSAVRHIYAPHRLALEGRAESPEADAIRDTAEITETPRKQGGTTP